MPSPSILVCSALAYDVLLHYKGQFAEGLQPTSTGVLSVCFRTKDHVRRFGGVGANIAWNLRLLNQPVSLIATVGGDGDEYVEFLAKHGIDTSLIQKIAHTNTATYIGSTDARHNLLSFYSGGADMEGTWPQITGNASLYPYAIIGPRTVAIVKEALTWCKNAGIPVFFDPGQDTLGFTKEEFFTCLDGSFALIANEHEWSLLEERFGLTPASTLNYVKMLIITRAENGVSLYHSHGMEDIPPCPAKAFKNPTGAGDGFRAGMLTGLAHGWSLTHAARLGCALASFVVEEDGALIEHLDSTALYKRAEITYGDLLPAL